jgi:hypothetical protein
MEQKLPNRKGKATLFLISMMFIITLFSLNFVSAINSNDCYQIGGNITVNGNYCVHTYNLTLNGTGFNAIGRNLNISILLVAGGGAGGVGLGGGGGGGGVIYNNSYIVNTNITVIVGNGGTNSAGKNSTFGSLNAIGGGYAGHFNNIQPTITGGGGLSDGAGAGSTLGASGYAGQGYAGGTGTSGLAPSYRGGGGGGAGSIGADGSTTGKGGDGLAFTIFNGTSIYYGGGGGAGGKGAGYGGGLGGLGGGGQGGTSTGTNITAGIDGLGGGGAGSGDGSVAGTPGGAGIVIITYIPNIILSLSPPNNTQAIRGLNVSLNCNVSTTTTQIKNISLWTNVTGTWMLNDTFYNNGTSTYSEDRIFVVMSADNKTGNAIFNVTVPINNFQWTCQLCDNSSVCLFASENRTIISANFTQQNVAYNNITTEGSIENFYVNVSTAEPILSAYFIYNNTQYSTSINSYGDNSYQLFKSFTIPNITINSIMPFYWSILTDSGNFNTTKNNQTILNIAIDNCAVQTLQIMNFSLVDEKLQTSLNINSSVEVDLNIYAIGSSTVLVNFSQKYTNQSTGSICISAGTLNNTNFTYDAQFRYTADNYAPEFYNIQNYNLNKNSLGNNITLYDLLSADSTEFKIIYKDANYVGVSNALIIIQRKYISEGKFKTVEAPLTDNYGNGIGHFDKNGVLYSIIVMKDGVILSTYNNILVVCQDVLTGQCDINLNAISSQEDFTDFNTYPNLIYRMTFNSTTKTANVNFITTDLSTATISLKLTKLDNLGNITLCQNSLTSSSGSFSCVVPDIYGNVTILAELFKDGTLVTSSIYTINPNPKDTFGNDGIIMVIMLLLIIPLVFISSPIGIIIGIIVGIGVAITLNIINGGSVLGIGSSFIWLIIAGGILIWKLAQRNQGGGI